MRKTTPDRRRSGTRPVADCGKPGRPDGVVGRPGATTSERLETGISGVSSGRELGVSTEGDPVWRLAGNDIDGGFVGPGRAVTPGGNEIEAGSCLLPRPGRPGIAGTPIDGIPVGEDGESMAGRLGDSNLVGRTGMSDRDTADRGTSDTGTLTSTLLT